MLEQIDRARLKVDELLVDVLEQRGLHRRVGAGISRGEADDEQRREGEEQTETQRHLGSRADEWGDGHAFAGLERGTRITYPTPRTVGINGGSAWSTLRRR